MKSTSTTKKKMTVKTARRVTRRVRSASGKVCGCGFVSSWAGQASSAGSRYVMAVAIFWRCCGALHAREEVVVKQTYLQTSPYQARSSGLCWARC